LADPQRTVLVSDNSNYLKQMQMKMTIVVSQGSVATLFQRGW